MVNYCCVKGCGRNSKLSNHLIYYSLPKDRNRQKLWLHAAGRDDLVKKSHLKLTYRVCSRHFTPQNVKNRNLRPGALPTLCLPGSIEKDIPDIKPVQHTDIVCNNCRNLILGYRYKCVTCPDYDLCPKCEMLETHPHHYMLRVPKPLKFKFIDNLISKWRTLFEVEHVKPDCTNETDTSGDSSDDEPITKYLTQHDSGVDLSDDVKDNIRKEVKRALKAVKDSEKNKDRNNIISEKVETKGTKRTAEKSVEENEKALKPIKKQKSNQMAPHDEQLIMTSTLNVGQTTSPEVVFADVNEIADTPAEVKEENHVLTSTLDDSVFVQPLLQVKISDDLSELMIEMTRNGEKTIYKY